MTLLPYQYVALRCVPRVEREEFVNIGVILFCDEAGFLASACAVDAERLRTLDADVDLDAVRQSLVFVDGICRGEAAVGARAAADPGTRFGYLKAPRSTVVQPGPVHGGLTEDPEAELARLLAALVG